MYPLAQAYDSVFLRSDVELGGTDQKFNLLLGRSLQKQYNMKEQIAILLPLIEGTDGFNKMSKSYDNYIAFNDTPNDMYGKVLSISDNLIFKYFELVTNISLKDINDYKLSLKSDKINYRDLKRKLAREIVSIYYDDHKASLAEQNFDNIFINKGVPDNINEIVVLENVKLIELLLNNDLVSSKSEAKRLISQSAIKINDTVVDDINLILKPGLNSVIKVGKRRFIKVI
jgi:tyrosyl-tRNA synthetase